MNCMPYGSSIYIQAGVPYVNNFVRHRFIDKDARDLDRLVYDAAERNINRQGIPLCVRTVCTGLPFV